MKVKVAVVLPYFGIGGAETMVSRLVSSMNLEKMDVEVICLYGEPLHNHLEDAIKNHGVRITYIGKGLGFSLSAVIRLWKVFSRMRPAVIHTHLSASVYCIPWILFHKQIMLHTVHSLPDYELPSLKKQFLMRIMYRLGKAVPVAISEEIRQRMVTYYRLKKAPELIGNPVDTSRFNLPRRPHDHIVIVTAGRLVAIKNQKFLIDAAARLLQEGFDVRLVILGDGPLMKELIRRRDQAGLTDYIEIPGNVDNVEEFFAAADIFALCSDYEGIPLVILEAMSAGLPIISTDVGGIKDILHRSGILVPPGAAETYIQMLTDLVSNPDLRDLLGQQGRSIAGRFDSALIAEQYMELYKKYAK